MKNRQLYKILDIFNEKNHPEIIHFRNGTHPGKNWYLKTVCYNDTMNTDTQTTYGKIWHLLSLQYKDIIKIMPVAYDWNNNILANMISIWIKNDNDILIKYENNQIEITFTDINDSFNMYIDIYNDIIKNETELYINNSNELSDDLKLYKSELNAITLILNNMKTKMLEDSTIIKVKKNKIIKESDI